MGDGLGVVSAAAVAKEFRGHLTVVCGGMSVAQASMDMGASQATFYACLNRDDVDDGRKPGLTTEELQELRALRKRAKELEQENEILRRAAAYPSQANLPEKGLPVRELAADEIPVAKSLRVLGFGRAAFYEWEANRVSNRDWADAHATHGWQDEYLYAVLADE